MPAWAHPAVSVLAHPAIVHDAPFGEADPALQRVGDRRVVRDDDHRGAELVADPVEQADDQIAVGPVELAGRLVGEQQLRRGGHRDRRGQPLLLAAGHPRDPLVGELGETELAQQLDRLRQAPARPRGAAPAGRNRCCRPRSRTAAGCAPGSAARCRPAGRGSAAARARTSPRCRRRRSAPCRGSAGAARRAATSASTSPTRTARTAPPARPPRSRDGRRRARSRPRRRGDSVCSTSTHSTGNAAHVSASRSRAGTAMPISARAAITAVTVEQDDERAGEDQRRERPAASSRSVIGVWSANSGITGMASRAAIRPVGTPSTTPVPSNKSCSRTLARSSERRLDPDGPQRGDLVGAAPAAGADRDRGAAHGQRRAGDRAGQQQQQRERRALPGELRSRAPTSCARSARAARPCAVAAPRRPARSAPIQTCQSASLAKAGSWVSR